MGIAIRVIDDVVGLRARSVTELQVAEQTSLRELLRQRISAMPPAGVNEKGLLTGLASSNARRGSGQRPSDEAALMRAATEAFKNNRLIVIVGDRQIADLDEPVTLAPETEITFLKLVPLVGG